MATEAKMDRNLALEAVRVTEAAALAASKLMGRGDEKMADQAAVDAMRTSLNALSIDGTVVIGEGERDEAPMLYIGEKVGTGGPKIDIALDPLEGTTITAKGLPNALAVMAMAEDGGFLNAPDVYMDKIAVGAGLPEGIVDLDKTPKQNLADLAKAMKVDVADLVVCILDRRLGHQHLHGLGWRAGRRAGGGGLALHRRPDPGPPVVPQRRREGPRQEVGHHRSQPQVLDARDGQGRRHVRGYGRHQRLDAERCAPLPQRRGDPLDHHAVEDRHGAVDIRPSQFLDRDWFAELGLV